MSTRKIKLIAYRTENVIVQIGMWFASHLWDSYATRLTQRLRRNKSRAVGVRPEVAALIERNMDDRPDLWADLARH